MALTTVSRRVCKPIKFGSMLFAVVLIVNSEAPAITVDVDSVAWPGLGTGSGLAEEITSTNLSVFTFHDEGSSSLTQTIQVASEFDLNSLYVIYGNGASSSIDVGLQIFEVTDSNASSVTDPNSFLLDATFSAPDEPQETVMQIFLDSPITLPANAGSDGYAIRFLHPDFQWDRTGSSAGSVDPTGKAYENGAEKSSGNRDFSLAISSQTLPPPLPNIFSRKDGDLLDPNSWDNLAAPDPNSNYNIISPHTLTATSTTWNGGDLVVQSGGALDLAVSAVDIEQLEVQAGGNLTSSATGDFAVGVIGPGNLNNLVLDGTANFSASAGADLFVDVDLTGTGELNFQSNGAGSNMFLTAAGAHEGTIRFNGTGDEVRLVDGEAFGRLEMNSVGGANRVVYNATSQVTGGRLVFNQPGVVQHAVAPPNPRIQAPGALEANAAVTVDLSISPAALGNERRFLVGALDGSSNITVNGTASDPSAGGITLNEFELGGSSQPSSSVPSDDYSGTISTSGFVALEIRRSLPDARVEVNNNAQLEMGFRTVAPSLSVEIGEIEVNSGGTLVIGYEQDGRHQAHQLVLTSEGSRTGSLTLASGTTTQMQVNGREDPNNLAEPFLFDSIAAQGSVTLDGTLEVLVNPVSDTSVNPDYTPTLGDTFDIITIIPEALSADFNGDDAVDPNDLAIWQSSYGVDDGGDADGDGLTTGLDFLLWQTQLGSSAPLNGSISGTFGTLTVTDPGSVMSGAGLAFQINYVSSTLVQLEVVAASPLVAIPEPSTLAILLCAMCPLASYRRRRFD